MEPIESILYSNQFGVITSQNVILYFPYGDRKMETEKISSFKLKHYRNRILSISILVISLGVLSYVFSNFNHLDMGGEIVLGIIALAGMASAIISWKGNYEIQLRTNSSEDYLESIKVPQDVVPEAEKLVNAYNSSFKS